MDKMVSAKDKESPSEEKKHTHQLIIIGTIGAVLVFLVWACSGVLIYFFVDEQSRGIAGDMFGAVNALFSGWAFLGVIIAIILQYQELKEQRSEIRFSRLAQQESAHALTEQLKTSDFRIRLESLNLLIEVQQRILERNKDPRTVQERERQSELLERLSLYEVELAQLIESEIKRRTN